MNSAINRTGVTLSWRAIIVMLLLPLVIFATQLSLVKVADPAKVKAAIVNLDRGTKIEGKFVPMGRQLAAEFLERDGENISWELADQKSADRGLTDGTYAAVVTIPSNFSEAAMSFSHNDAKQAKQARVQVTVSKNAPVADTVLAQDIARISTESLNHMLTSQYLDGIYLGFNKMGDQFGKIVDGAAKLDNGAGKLADGASKANAGAGQLVTGLRKLDQAGGQLSSGGGQLSQGSSKLSSGASQLAAGAQQLNAGVQEMASKMPQLTDGVGQLANGAEQLLPGVAEYARGASAVVGGVSQLKGGIDKMIAGMDAANTDFSELQKLVDGSQQLSDGLAKLAAALKPLDGIITDEMVAALRKVQEKLSNIGGSLEEADALLRGYANGSVPVPQEVNDAAATLKAGFTCPVADPARCEELRTSYEQGVDAAIVGGFKTGAATASAFLNAKDPTTGLTFIELAKRYQRQIGEALTPAVDGLQQVQELVTGVQKLADGAQQLHGGIQQLATQLPAELKKNLGQLRGGLQQLSDGAGEIVQKAQPLVTNAEPLAQGSSQLLDGIRQLNSQLGQLPDGVQQLASGTQQLSTGASQLASGAQLLNGGVLKYVDGVWQYTRGVGAAADGASQLGSGLSQLSTGAHKLSQGTGTFTSELRKGAKEVPHYSEADRKVLAKSGSSPVAHNSALFTWAATPITALIISVALWLAALASFVVIRPIPADVVDSHRSSMGLWWRTVRWPLGIVGSLSVLLGFLGAWLLKLPLGTAAGMVPIALLVGLVFVVTHHALASWWGNLGRGIALVLLAVTVALALSSSTHRWVEILASLSPLHAGMLLIRSWAAGANSLLTIALLVFVGLAMAGLSWASVAMRRQMKPKRFKLRHVEP